jgi:hypothetical protein
MSKTIQYVVLVILFLITFVTILQLRTKVDALEKNSDMSSPDSIADLKTSATTALSTANTAKDTANTALSTANAISDTANTALSTANASSGTATTALSTANAAKDTANTANSSQTTFASGFSTARVVPTFQVSNSLTSVASVDSAGGYIKFNPTPSAKMSFQLMMKSVTGHENDTNAYFDITTPYKCTLFTDWSFFASSSFDDTDLDPIVQCKVSQTSASTFRVKFVGNGKSTNYGRLTLNGNWTQ